LVQTVRRTPNAHLTAEGISLKQQATLGFTLAQQYASSQRATEMAAAADQARARRIWIALGLSESASNVEADVALLNTAILQILSENPKDLDEIEAGWKAAAVDEPKLARIDQEKVIPFIAHVGLGHPWQPSEPQVTDAEPEGNPVQ